MIFTKILASQLANLMLPDVNHKDEYGYIYYAYLMNFIW